MMSTFFKKCPSCGRRFEVKHTGETLEKTEIKTETITRADALSRPTDPLSNPGYVTERESLSRSDHIDIAPGGAGGTVGGVAVGTEEVEVEEKTFLEAYKCSHCGYSWTEERVKDKELGQNR